MTDFSKCVGGDCPIKESCLRFTSLPAEIAQTYFIEPPYDKEDKKCYYLLNPVKKEKR